MYSEYDNLVLQGIIDYVIDEVGDFPKTDKDRLFKGAKGGFFLSDRDSYFGSRTTNIYKTLLNKIISYREWIYKKDIKLQKGKIYAWTGDKDYALKEHMDWNMGIIYVSPTDKNLIYISSMLTLVDLFSDGGYKDDEEWNKMMEKSERLGDDLDYFKIIRTFSVHNFDMFSLVGDDWLIDITDRFLGRFFKYCINWPSNNPLYVKEVYV